MSALKCPQCGLVNFASATQCKRCGTLFVQDISSKTGTNLQGFVTEDGYVLPPPPSVGMPGTGIWREGVTLVFSKDAVLPQRCVKCNTFTNGRLTRKLSWHHPALYLLLLVAWLAYLIVAMIVRKRATVELGICEDHRAKRRNYVWMTVALIFLGFASIAGAIVGEELLPALLGILMLLTGIIFGVIATRVTYPAKIDDRFVWLKGVSADYLNQFPSWPAM